MKKLGWVYEKFGTCEGCHDESASVFRRTIDGARMPLSAFFCLLCRTKVENGKIATHCPTCAAELKPLGPRLYRCVICVTRLA